MNRTPSHITPEQLDRLVDGELNEAERKTLLEHLEREPDAWRRCALAFLEAQSLGDELRAMVREPSTVVPAVVPVVPRREPSGMTPRVWFSLAASFLLAFGLGLALRSESPSVHYAAEPDKPLAEAVPDTPPPVDAAQEPEAQEPEFAALDGASFDDFVLALSDLEETYGISSPAVPPTVVRALQRMGHQVRQHRELLPVELEDGRLGWVPAERIELHYVGNQYQ